MLPIYSSDASLALLESLDPPTFDAASLQGLTPDLLHSLLKLTFITDEKLSVNPLFPKPQKQSTGQGKARMEDGTEKREEKDQAKKDGKGKQTENEEIATLERRLDEDIAR